MIAVTLVGKEVNGKKRWLGVGSLSFQPTEFVKIALIIFLAVLITRMGAKVNEWNNMFRVMGLALPIAGIVAANNLSSGIIIVGIAFVMLLWPVKSSGHFMSAEVWRCLQSSRPVHWQFFLRRSSS